MRVVDGNYEAYQLLLGRQSQEPDAEQAGESHLGKVAKAPPKTAKSIRGKRRFPFRKVTDLENEILARETQIEQLHQELAQEATYRDGAAFARSRRTSSSTKRPSRRSTSTGKRRSS